MSAQTSKYQRKSLAVTVNFLMLYTGRFGLREIHNSDRGDTIIDFSHRHIDLVRSSGETRNVLDDNYRLWANVIFHEDKKERERENRHERTTKWNVKARSAALIPPGAARRR